MLNEESVINSELRIKLPNRAKFIVVAWLFVCIIIFLFWLNFFYDNKVNSVSLGDIGAFLSGVFSVLAFYGFIEAYLVQSQELRLQRFELKESIKAQKGSEQALKEQSEALKSQLKINEEQFNLYLLEAKAKIPVFTLSKILVFKVEFLHEENCISNEIDLLEEPISSLPFEKDTYILKEIIILVEVNNIGGGGKLIDIKSLTEINNMYYAQFTGFDSMTSSNTETYDNYLVEFKFKIDSMDLDIFLNAETFKAFVIDLIERIKFESNFRSHERSYKQSYKICRTSSFDQLLQHQNSSIRNFEQVGMQKLLAFGYDIEFFE
ncbi:hypothetical protein IOD06_09495 [Psychrobacter sp. N25K4-3-2]|uniref:hypothetical protein n=1 Tax=Psychrobacter sp. N25K4-3-2 TaxID=2785026 RepID=UPI00188B55BE|nr:hypothetical protein [Psychrobacter sp. N25K4-3-2]MBF4490119.1 hypothetical protein [Psychrobacter sp. N25K4-3-2]